MAVKNIIILDDHKLYRSSVSLLLNEKFPVITINQFSESDSALEYFLQCNIDKQRIDLIITDQIHPGPDGFAFASACRIIEKKYGRVSPILLLSMTVNDSAQDKINFNYVISPECPFSLCLPKSVEKDKLIHCISKLMM